MVTLVFYLQSQAYDHGNLKVGIDFAKGYLEAFHATRREFPQRILIGVKKRLNKWFPVEVGRFRLDVMLLIMSIQILLGWGL